MTPNIFISYSRREAPFVTDLVGRLEGTGYPVWLDYRSMVPGRPWAEQIEEGIRGADVILLVVSDAALQSQYVEKEWRSVLEYGKRVILILFEANDLPTELEKFEWVDFRGSYKTALAELVRQLEQPEQEEFPIPETGFKVPRFVWGAFALSLVVALFSLPTFWCVVTIWYLAPLPYRILKRNFDYSRVQAALLFLPLAQLGTVFLFPTSFWSGVFFGLGLLAFPLAGAMWLVLRSRGMQRWGKPSASRPPKVRSANVSDAVPQPTRFFMDYAPQDRVAGRRIAARLERHGHTPVETPGEADVVLTFISRYKSASVADPQHKMVIPILLDNTQEIDADLRKVQWIDFRRGLRNLDALAILLCEPQRLLKALGLPPSSDQTFMPRAVQILVYILAGLGILSVANWVPYLLYWVGQFVSAQGFLNTMFWFIASLGLYVGLIVAGVRALGGRRGWLASFPGVIGVFVALMVLLFYQIGQVATLEDSIGTASEQVGGLTAVMTPFMLMCAASMLPLLLLFNFGDLRAWFPALSLRLPKRRA
ncbi:MAG: toll/interleukin-1 receptor domain-containing protein [Anaerolineae bacterium]|nr:MAG: toll/interleukin-1 receptor domain-containing protein [Anaerolineae bacterium]